MWLIFLLEQLATIAKNNAQAMFPNIKIFHVYHWILEELKRFGHAYDFTRNQKSNSTEAKIEM
jgi:hypothetical protein